MPLPETLGTWAGIAQAVAAVIAIGLGGVFAWRRGFLFRYGQPHLTISHEVTHRRISDSYVHLELTATLRNSSRVKVEVLDGLFTVQQLAPVSDEHAETLYGDTFIDQRYNAGFLWDTLDEGRLVWERNGLLVEPGESVAETFEYIAPDSIGSVLLTTFFYNQRVLGKIPEEVNPHEARPKRYFLLWERSGPRGWFRTTAYDIMSMDKEIRFDDSEAAR